MKKIDSILAVILGVGVLVICLLAWLMPQTDSHEGHEHAGHVHSEACEHDHDADGKADHDSGHVHEDGTADHDADHVADDTKPGTDQAEHADHDHDTDRDSKTTADADHSSHSEEAGHSETTGHDHAKEETHEGAGSEIALSANALRNISLDSPDAVMKLEPGSFTKTHVIPAIIMEFAGRTTSKVPAPYAGIVTKIYHEPGESVQPGEPLFDLTLSLPAMMDGQLALLKLLETQGFLTREIAEIDANLNGLAPQRRRELDVRLKETLIEITNQRNALRVLGLPDETITRIEAERKPVTHVITVPVPPVSHHGFISDQNPGKTETSVVFETLFVNVGASVEVGQMLCDVCDLCELTVRGDAFAVNEGILLDALRKPETPVRVTFEGTGKQPLENLRLRMVESKIDEKNRTLSCFADFANVKLNQEGPEPDAHPHRPHYVHWLFKPGERCQMEISYDTIENVFVVPAGAVARDVQETFVFELEEELTTGEKVWHRHPVHLLFRTREKAVLANDGTLKPGIRIAARSASFLQDAINAQSGSGTKIDPHAGHNH